LTSLWEITGSKVANATMAQVGGLSCGFKKGHCGFFTYQKKVRKGPRVLKRKKRLRLNYKRMGAASAKYTYKEGKKKRSDHKG